MVVGAPDVDEVLPPAVELVAVVREVGQEIGGVAVGLHEHAVALVAEVGGAQPGGAVGLEHVSPVAEIGEHLGDGAALVQRALREPGVELHADAIEVATNAFDGPAVPQSRACSAVAVSPSCSRIRSAISTRYSPW